MNFPLGSLSLVIVVVLLLAGLLENEAYRRYTLLIGLAAILAGSAFTVKIPSPQGTEVNLNIGEIIVGGTLLVLLWMGLSLEERYRSSQGTLLIGLTLYSMLLIFDMEPGIISQPVFISVPLSVALAVLLGRSGLGAVISLCGGAGVATFLKYLEICFLPSVIAQIDLPGPLIWNTVGLGSVTVLCCIWFSERVQKFMEKNRKDLLKVEEVGQTTIDERFGVINDNPELTGEDNEDNI